MNFNLNGSALNTYNFSKDICDNGTALHFGNGTFNIAGGVASGGGSNTSFGYGTFKIGVLSSGANSCGAPTGYSIYNTGSIMTFGSSTNASSFTLAGGLTIPAVRRLSWGRAAQAVATPVPAPAAATPSLRPRATASTSVLPRMAMRSIWAVVRTSISEMRQARLFKKSSENLNVSSGGGSCLWLGASSNHDIKGFFSTAGGTTLGAGHYTVTKYVSLGGNGGGDVTCGGSTVGIYGNGVTFDLAVSTDSSSCAGVSGTAFCVAAGYNHVTLVAPGSGDTTQGLVVLGSISSTYTAPASFGEGIGDVGVGAFYFPDGAITLSGAATLGNGASQCLMLIGLQVTLSGGSAVASTCSIPGYSGSGSSGAVALVQ